MASKITLFQNSDGVVFQRGKVKQNQKKKIIKSSINQMKNKKVVTELQERNFIIILGKNPNWIKKTVNQQ